MWKLCVHKVVRFIIGKSGIFKTHDSFCHFDAIAIPIANTIKRKAW